MKISHHEKLLAIALDYFSRANQKGENKKLKTQRLNCFY